MCRRQVYVRHSLCTTSRSSIFSDVTLDTLKVNSTTNQQYDESISKVAIKFSRSIDGEPVTREDLFELGLTKLADFEHLGKLIDIEDCISNLQMAVGLTDDSHPDKPTILSNLGQSQLARFDRLGELSDLEHSISNLRRATQLTNDGHPDKAGCHSVLGICQAVRFTRLGELTDIEDSIANLQTAVQITEYCHPDKAICLANLGVSQQARFNRLGQLTDIEHSISNMHRAAQFTNDGHPDKARTLSHLGRSQLARFERLGELTDLEHSIFNLRSAVQLTDDEHPDKAAFLSILGVSQRVLFERLWQLTDLEHSISNITKAIQVTDDGHPDKSGFILNLGISQRARFRFLGEPTDLMASISAFRTAAQSKTTYPRHALLAARYWADLSYDNGDILSALDGYRTALKMLPKVAWLGLSTASRQNSLSQDDSEHLSCLAATCAIRQGRLEEAVELLDLGRSVFWQQASSLRVELEELKAMDPELADELERVGQKLDGGNFSEWLLRAEEQNPDINNTEDIGKRRRRLVGEWEVLLERARRLPHFQHFLKPASFRQLCQAAAGGYVIIINVSRYGVDALIFDDTHQIEHVPLRHADIEQLSDFADELLSHRPINASEVQRRSYTGRYLKPALRHIWNDIVIPIFDKLQVPLNGNLGAPERRIWWYLTGPLTFIPIHASGNGAIDTSHLFISSYVTTLGSLLRAQKKERQTVIEKPKLLVVSQRDTPGQQLLPLSVEEADKVVKVVSLAGWQKEDIVHLDGSDATVDRVLGELDLSSWIHFACHGMQHSTSGMDSAFALNNGPLKLGQVASKKLTIGQFAFLSACHTAAGLQGLPGEAMHLAGGLQFAGFLSVIATMWGVSDQDTLIVADHTYRYLFRNGLCGYDLSETAMALNRAILLLRQDPKVTIDRWAPFIHFGI